MSDHSRIDDALLRGVLEGDSAALDRLVGLLYHDLRRVAARMMRRERPDHTLQPSALVNEALVKLLSSDHFRTAPERANVFAAAAKAMRDVLVDHHRARAARKRSGALRRHPLDVVLDQVVAREGIRFEELNEALDELARHDARACLVTTFHVFLGMSLPEVGESLELSRNIVERDWKYARAWLRDRLKQDESRP